MFVSDSLTMRQVGVLALQDHRSIDLDQRLQISATRVLGRRDGAGQDGRWELEEEITGDIVGASVWKKDSRPTAAWSWAWSSMVTERGTVTPGDFGSAIPEGLRPAVGPADDRRIDDRFAAEPLVLPDGWPKFPKGWTGLTVASALETAQEMHFHPTDPRLIACHRDRREFNSIVTDVLKGDLDPAGALGSHVFVVRSPGLAQLEAAAVTTGADVLKSSGASIVVTKIAKPGVTTSFVAPGIPGVTGQFTGVGGTGLGAIGTVGAVESLRDLRRYDNSLAWLTGHSNGLIGGLVIDNEPEEHSPAVSPPSTTTPTDRPDSIFEFLLNRPAGAGPINVTLRRPSFTARFRPGGVKDLPSLGVSVGKRAGEPLVLGMASVNYGGPFDTGTPKDKHRIGKDADGRIINPLHIATTALFRMRDDADGPLAFELPYPDGVVEWDVATGVRLGWHNRSGTWRWWTSVPYLEVGDSYRSPLDYLDGGGSGTEIRPHLMFPAQTAHSVLLGRPASTVRGEIDLRTRTIKVEQDTPEDVLDAMRRADRIPITARLEAFGAQRNTEEWDLTRGVYPGGIGPGGFAVLSPGSRIEDLTPEGLTLPETYFGVADPVRFAFGLPNRETGKVESGHSIRNSARDLIFAVHDSGGDLTDYLTLTSGGLLCVAVESGLTASAAQVQGDVPLTKTVSEIAAVGSDGDVATLMGADIGCLAVVVNNGAKRMDLYPQSGDEIDALGVDAALSIAAGARAILIGRTAAKWDSIGNDTRSIVTVTGNTTLDGNSGIVLVDAASGSLTITLPAAAERVGAPSYFVKKIDPSGNTVTLDGNGTETIDGSLTEIITSQYDSIELVSDGSNWHII